jgi:predicted  nucleic acid-binding Zn-ribbon protein
MPIKEMSETVLSELKVMVARVEERQIALQKHLDKLATTEKVESLEDKIDEKATSKELVSLTERVDNLENNQTWITRIVIGAVILAVLGAIGLARKFGV